MLKKLLEGFYFGVGLFLVFGIIFGIVYAVGFHSAEEILPGTFSGNFTFTNKVNVKELCDESGNNCNIVSNGFGSNIIQPGTIMIYNFSSCPSGWSEFTIPNLEEEVPIGASAIGNLNGNGGLDASFDGVINEIGSASQGTLITYATVGKYWGFEKKVINQVILYAPSDSSFNSPGRTHQVILEGSNDNSNWDSLGSGTVIDAIGTMVTIPSSSSNSYNYHRVRLYYDSTARTYQFGEAEFYADSNFILCKKD